MTSLDALWCDFQVMILPSTSQNRGMQDAAKSRGRSFTCFKVRYCSCCEERSIRSKKMKIAGKKNLTRLESTEGNQKNCQIGYRINVGPTPIFWNHSTGWKTNVVNHPPPNMGPPSASTFTCPTKMRVQEAKSRASSEHEAEAECRWTSKTCELSKTWRKVA